MLSRHYRIRLCSARDGEPGTRIWLSLGSPGKDSEVKTRLQESSMGSVLDLDRPERPHTAFIPLKFGVINHLIKTTLPS